MGAQLSSLREMNFDGKKKKKKKKYVKLGAIVPSDALERRVGRNNRLYLFDLQALTVVKDHNGVRRTLTYVPGWVEQIPRDGYLEYWFYFSYDREKKWPAAKARLPWPSFQNAPVQILQSFVHVVNRVAHRTILSLIPPAEIRHLMQIGK